MGNYTTCKQKYGDPWVKNTRYAWQYVPTLKQLFGQEAADVMQKGYDWWISQGNILKANNYAASRDFAIANPTAPVPNPNFYPTKQEFFPVEFNACMAS